MRTTWYLTPPEIWESANQLRALTAALSVADSRPARHATLRRVLHHSMNLSALVAGSMSRDEAYAFWQLGRDLERADMTTRALDVRVASMPNADQPFPAFENVLWMSTLNSVAAHQMFRRSTGRHVDAASVTSFLLTDADFPRSVFHCLDRISFRLKQLPGSGFALQEAISAQHRVHELTPAPSSKESLTAILEEVQQTLANVSSAVEETYWLERLRVG
jgi:uncharacterized alpha-E superfamily protein